MAGSGIFAGGFKAAPSCRGAGLPDAEGENAAAGARRRGA